MAREPGYYWVVEMPGFDEPEVAHWTGTDWYLPGCEGAVSTEDIRVVGGRLDEPSDLTAAETV